MECTLTISSLLHFWRGKIFSVYLIHQVQIN
jgi:hypothetical protein